MWLWRGSKLCGPAARALPRPGGDSEQKNDRRAMSVRAMEAC